MKKLLFILIVTEIIALSIVIGFKMKSTPVEYEKKFRWTVERLKQMPGEVESLPFSVVKNNSWIWKIVLKPSLAGEVRILLKHLDTNHHHQSDISVAGNIAFKNSTHHLIAREYLRPRLVDSEVLLFQAPTFTWIRSTNENFKRAINSTLILDFAFNITAPFTFFEHPQSHSTVSD